MKKTYKVDVDCANCANKMEFEDGVDPQAVMEKARENCKIVEDDCEIFL